MDQNINITNYTRILIMLLYQMDQIKQNKLDSCQKTIGNLEGLDTIGNQLCDQVYFL